MPTLLLVLGILCNLAYLTYDFFPFIEKIVGRRRLGVSGTVEAYYHRAREIAAHWLVRRVATAKSEPHRPSTLLLGIPSLVRWGSRLHDSWPQAMLAKGLAISYRLHHMPGDLESVQRYLHGFLRANRKDGKLTPYSLEQAMNGEALLILYQETHDERYRQACDDLAAWLLARQAREGDTLAYGNGAEGALGKRYVDTLPMICPFLARYGTLFQCPPAVRLAVMQLTQFIDYGVDQRTGLPFHAYAPDMGNVPVGLVGWGRGTGWFALGLVDTLAALLPENLADGVLVQSAQQLVGTLLACQRSDGGWGTLLTDRSSRYDSSATALFAYMLHRMAVLGLCTAAQVEKPVQHAVQSLQQHTRRNGVVDFAQGNCNGFDKMSGTHAPQVYVQGMVVALLAGVVRADSQQEVAV